MIAIGGGGFIPARILRTFLKTETKRNIPIQAIGLSLYEALPGVSRRTPTWTRTKTREGYLSREVTEGKECSWSLSVRWNLDFGRNSWNWSHSNSMARFLYRESRRKVLYHSLSLAGLLRAFYPSIFPPLQLGTNYNLNGGLLGRRILVVDEVDDSRSTLSYALAELQADVKKQLMKIENIEERERLDRETKFAVFVVHNKLKKKAAEIPGECSYYSGLDVEWAFILLFLLVCSTIATSRVQLWLTPPDLTL